RCVDPRGSRRARGGGGEGRGELGTAGAAAGSGTCRRPGGGVRRLGGTPAMGSHKGYGRAVMGQILGGRLSGGALAARRIVTRRPGEPDDVGHFFLALNPDAFRASGSFESDMDDLIDTLHDTPPARPDEPVLVAGEPEAAERARRREQGIPI
ncbi:Ldh family oxidoreductase, partial [Achromobacter ruhlandii]|nr:Ldh family oxidoreductase [Achromobacter ruhlandii]